MTTKKQRRAPNHIFRVKLENGKVIEFPCKVRYGKKPIALLLEEAHVQRAIDLNGAGNSSCCSMANSVHDQAYKFPHKVLMMVDWFYKRAYVVSKVKRGIPVECYVYAHYDQVAHLNDSQGGQLKLLKILQAEGPRLINLLPIKRRGPQPKGRPEGRPTGSRSKPTGGRGARLRMTTALAGVAKPARLPRKVKAGDHAK